MKIAHLVLAHKNPRQLAGLIRLLDHPGFDFYIHLDRKVDIHAFSLLKKYPNVYFIRRRIAVKWGGYGTIAATLAGFREIDPLKYAYINVMSGQDMPLKTPAEIYGHFRENQGTEFITCLRLRDEWNEALPRIMSYHFINWKIYGKHRLERLVNMFMPSRRFPDGFVPVGRSNWFALSAAAVQYILDFVDRRPGFVQYFKYCWGADEIMFPTIIYNSSFRYRIRENLLHVEWPEGCAHPKIFTRADFPALQNSDKLFARKFDEETDRGIIDLIAQDLRQTARQA